ncbi:DUF4032 domain-containing protein [Dermatobacter hominis]|uniref:DUF4032 domain-containing protein n=1 Tax=Dermatobacter hominis TaxID=2884263 RepID=UPI001D0FD078|nr:DUF4032 domain-containing protein [Dermatobacter hominis]UDY34572.1 DUF4032 domain-containing protein [Dermatobacter hominis]
MAAPELRLRQTPPGLLALPWTRPLGEWRAPEVELRELPVGPSRHLVRFVESDGRLWALKELSPSLANREYEVLRELERRHLAAVRVAGVVTQPALDTAILVTHYLERSWQYRRLFMRVAGSLRAHRRRLLDAMALLLVDLHRNGVYWGDCSLANTLFIRDGQAIQAWFVDAETAELHDVLSDGQRRADLDTAVENVAGGLLDVAAARGPATLPGEMTTESLLAEAQSVATRYDQLWELLFDAPVVDLGDHDRIAARLARLEDLGFELDEVRFEPTGERTDQLRMRVAVGGRSYHSDRLRALTGIDAGEGQAAILMNDLLAYAAALRSRSRRDVSEEEAARAWYEDAFLPGVAKAQAVLGDATSPVQAYCDLLEVRWLLSEAAGRDVGDDAALAVLARREPPDESAATLVVLDPATTEIPAVPPPTTS